MNNYDLVAQKIANSIKNKLYDNAVDEIGEISKDVLLETIEDIVYEGEFQPYGNNAYERRGEDGGYKDRENIYNHLDEEKEGDMITISTTNETLGTHDAYGERIDEIIESGIGYTWKRVPPPRPVFQTAKDKISDEKNEIISVIERAIK